MLRGCLFILPRIVTPHPERERARLSETYQRSVDGHSANTALILIERIREQNRRDVCLARDLSVFASEVAYLRREADRVVDVVCLSTRLHADRWGLATIILSTAARARAQGN